MPTAAQLRERLARFSALPLPDAGRRRAAVALVVLHEGTGAQVPGLVQPQAWSDAPALLLTRRAEGLRRHAGQWALPGGRVDDGESAEQAARRELAEETGLQLDAAAEIGRLDDYATRSGYVVTPVLLWGGRAERLQANPDEVASLHRIPVAELMRADAPLLDAVPGGGHPVLRMPIGSSWIAAPTAAFLYQFREWLLCDRPTRVVHFDQPRFAWA